MTLVQSPAQCGTEQLYREVQAQGTAPSQVESTSTSQMGVSENRGTLKSSILMGLSIINHPAIGVPTSFVCNLQWKKLRDSTDEELQLLSLYSESNRSRRAPGREETSLHLAKQIMHTGHPPDSM